MNQVHKIVLLITYASSDGSDETVLLEPLMLVYTKPGLEVIKLEYSLRLKIKRNDWLLADTCPQAANHCP